MDHQDGWRMTTVGGAGRLQLGRARHPDWHVGPEMRPYLRVANVFEDRIVTDDVMTMDFSGVFEKYRLHPGDILLNEGQSPHLLGRPAIYRGQPADVAFTNSLIRFQASAEVLPEWALLVFRRHMRSGRFRRESRITTNIAHLSMTRLKEVEFPIPPLGEQVRRVEWAGEALLGLARMRENAAQARKRSAGLRRALLDAAFTGRLVGRSVDTEIVEELAGVAS
jgi:type I restriction enzyme S subunit